MVNLVYFFISEEHIKAVDRTGILNTKY